MVSDQLRRFSGFRWPLVRLPPYVIKKCKQLTMVQLFSLVVIPMTLFGGAHNSIFRFANKQFDCETIDNRIKIYNSRQCINTY